MAITIAVRYTAVRRQGAPDPTTVDPSAALPGAPVLEVPVLRYPSTYARLLPILARTYVLIGLGRSVVRALAPTVSGFYVDYLSYRARRSRP